MNDTDMDILYRKFINDFEAFFNAMTEPAIVYNEKGIVVYINDAGITSLGFNPKGLSIQKILLSSVETKKAGNKDNVLYDALKGEVVKDHILFIMAPDGKEKKLSLSAFPIKIGGKIDQVICLWHHSIQDKKEKLLNQDKATLLQKVDKIQIELVKKTNILEDKNNQIKQQSEIIDKLFANTQFLIAFLDTDFNFIRVNKAYAISEEKDEDFFVGKNHFDLYPNEENRAIFNSVLETGKSYITYAKPFSYPNKPEQGITYWDWSLNPIKDEDGNVTGLILILLDVSERKKNEIELGEAKRLSDIGALATTVAHELRSPLGVIQGTVYNVKRKNKDDKLIKNMERIERKVAESEKIINNLLNYSRIKQPDFKKIHFYNFLNECINDIKKQYNNPEININQDYESFKDISIKIDPFQTREVFLNILNNAYQAVLNTKGNIYIRGYVDSATLKIDIQDNGDGIEKTDLEKIFEPFFTRKSKGTGLGLTICRELIHLHNGSIKIESKKGEGTLVHISLPLRN